MREQQRERAKEKETTEGENLQLQLIRYENMIDSAEGSTSSSPFAKNKQLSAALCM